MTTWNATPADAPVWYRYEERHYAAPLDEYDNPVPGGGSTHIYCMELRMYKVTPKGNWVSYAGFGKFILRDARKKFACPTRAEAMESFLARKRRHAGILRNQLVGVENAIRCALDMRAKGLEQAGNDVWVPPLMVDAPEIKRLPIKELLINPETRKELIDGMVKATIEIGRDGGTPVK